MINYNYTYRADIVQRNPTTRARQTCSATTVRRINRQQVTPDHDCRTSLMRLRDGPPRLPLRSLSVGSHLSKRRGGDPPRPLGRTYRRRAIDNVTAKR